MRPALAPAAAPFYIRALPSTERSTVARTTPVEFYNQVKAETRKVVWPTRRETVTTAIMVVILTTVLALFFLGVDSILNAIVQGLLKLAQ